MSSDSSKTIPLFTSNAIKRLCRHPGIHHSSGQGRNEIIKQIHLTSSRLCIPPGNRNDRFEHCPLATQIYRMLMQIQTRLHGSGGSHRFCVTRPLCSFVLQPHLQIPLKAATALWLPDDTRPKAGKSWVFSSILTPVSPRTCAQHVCIAVLHNSEYEMSSKPLCPRSRRWMAEKSCTENVTNPSTASDRSKGAQIGPKR